MHSLRREPGRRACCRTPSFAAAGGCTQASRIVAASLARPIAVLPQADPSLPSLESDAFPPPPSQPAAAPLASGRPPVPLPRSSSAASAAASSAPAVPAPAQPLPPRGAWAQKQPAVMAVVPPPPPPPRGAASNVAAAAAPPAPPTAKAGGPPAAQQQQQEPKLSKSQRKNLRRAEKKAAAAAVATEPDAPSLDSGDSSQQAVESPPAAHPAPPCRHALPAPSPVPPPGFSPRAAAVAEAADVVPASPSSYPADMPLPPHFAPAPPEEPVACADLLDRCLQLAVQHKLRRQVESLTALGFAPAAALAAVQQHGGDLEAAVATLLEQVRGHSKRTWHKMAGPACMWECPKESCAGQHARVLLFAECALRGPAWSTTLCAAVGLLHGSRGHACGLYPETLPAVCSALLWPAGHRGVRPLRPAEPGRQRPPARGGPVGGAPVHAGVFLVGCCGWLGDWLGPVSWGAVAVWATGQGTAGSVNGAGRCAGLAVPHLAGCLRLGGVPSWCGFNTGHSR